MVFPGLIGLEALKSSGVNDRRWQELLPELVMLLIKASSPNSKAIFPVGDNIYLDGVDGNVFSEIRYGDFIPQGSSSWEVGTDAIAYSKATKDMKKRAENIAKELKGGLPTSKELKDMSDEERLKEISRIKAIVDRYPPTESLVLVVTGDEGSGEMPFNHYKELIGGLWKEVIVVTATDLYSWLLDFPGVHTWISYKRGSFQGGARPLIAVIEDWENATIPRLPASILEASEEWVKFSNQIEDAVRSDQKLINIIRSHQDDLVKICHALFSIDGVEARSIVVDTPDAWFSLYGATQSDLILIPSFEGPAVPSQQKSGPTVVSMIDSMDSFQGLEKSDFLNQKRLSPRIVCPRIEVFKNNQIVNQKTRYNRQVEKMIQELDAMSITQDPSDRERKQFSIKKEQLVNEKLNLTGSEMASLSRSLTLFRKRSMIKSPSTWSTTVGDPIGISALLLAGSWDASNPRDRKVLEVLTGRDFLEVEAWLNSKGIREFFDRHDDLYIVDPYTLDDTNFPFRIQTSAVERWQKIVVDLVRGKKKAWQMSPSLQKGLLSTLVRFSMLNEQKIIKTASNPVAPIRDALFVDSVANINTGMIWDRPGQDTPLNLVWEAFPMMTIKQLATEPLDSMYWQKGVEALEWLSQSEQYAEFVADIALDTKFFKSDPERAVILAARLLNPWFPLLNMPPTEKLPAASSRIKLLQALKVQNPKFASEVLRKIMLNSNGFSYNNENGVRNWDHRWVNEEIYTDNLLPFWQLALEMNCFTASEMFLAMKKTELPSLTSILCDCSTSHNDSRCNTSKTVFPLIADMVTKEIFKGTPSWTVGDHLELEHLMEVLHRLRASMPKAICAKAWPIYIKALNLSVLTFDRHKKLLDSAPKYSEETSQDHPQFHLLLKENPLEALDFLIEIPEGYRTGVNLNLVGRAAGAIIDKRIPTEEQFKNWPAALRLGFATTLDFRAADDWVPSAEIFSRYLQELAFASKQLTLENHKWAKKSWSAERVSSAYSLLKEVDLKDAIELIELIDLEVAEESFKPLFSAAKIAFVKMSEAERNSLLKTLVGIIKKSSAEWPKAWTEEPQLNLLVRSIKQRGDEKKEHSIELGELMFSAGGQVTPALASRLMDDATLTINLLKRRPEIDSVYWVRSFDYTSNDLSREIQASSERLAFWAETMLDLASKESAATSMQLLRFVASALTVSLTSSRPPANQTLLLELIVSTTLNEMMFTDLSLWVGPVQTSYKTEASRWGEDLLIEEPEKAAALDLLIKNQKYIDLNLKLNLLKISKAMREGAITGFA